MPKSILSAGSFKIAALVFAAVALGNAPASAADKVRVGKSVAIAWTFTPMDIGKEMGIWAKHGLDVEISSFGGDAKLQQAMAANGIDFGLGSGPGHGLRGKGRAGEGRRCVCRVSLQSRHRCRGELALQQTSRK